MTSPEVTESAVAPKAKILYLSYNGLDEPLVQSQVLAYLRKLRLRGYSFHLVTFERNSVSEKQDYARKSELQGLGIEWTPLRAKRGMGAVSTLLDILCGVLVVRPLVKSGIDLIHARSFVPAVIARYFKMRNGIRFVNDLRGFWIDEKVYKGSLEAGSVTYRLGKRLEAWVLSGSDYLVSLTHAGQEALSQFDCFDNVAMPPVATIPTCVDLEIFEWRPGSSRSANELTVGYVGSMSADYLPEQVFRVFSKIQQRLPLSRLHLVSRSSPTSILRLAHDCGVPESSYQLVFADPGQVPGEIAQFDVALSFIRPGYAKTASCPTKLAEYLAVGVPVICSSGIGDVDTIVRGSAVGLILDHFGEEDVQRLIDQLPALVSDVSVARRCRDLAVDYFSLEKGVTQYDHIYTALLHQQDSDD